MNSQSCHSVGRGHISEGTAKKGGVNPFNPDAPRPSPPGGSKPTDWIDLPRCYIMGIARYRDGHE